MSAIRTLPTDGAEYRRPRDGATSAALVPVFSGTRRVVNGLGIAVWAAALVYFWVWWLRPDHVVDAGRFAVVTIVLAWTTLVPAYFIVLFARARIMPPPTGAPPSARIAIVVTKAPAEPFPLVAKTLEGALDQRGVVHDTWLADEDPTPETEAWCAAHGVRISTRKGVAEYHRETWPRRTRCKEGNLAYFYDHVGYDRYDIVAQFDADHVPTRDYLRHAVAPFADPAVGYVSAPSICDANAQASWSARGRLHVEASMHGSLQVGYNAGLAPLCIGSHYTVRTAALRAVGGLGPELAEDHSTTLILNAGGWTGIHAVDAIAHGRGPETFADLVVQEFQWARSLVTILLRWSPALVGDLSGPKRFQFLFSQTWYPCFSGVMALAVAMPVFALATGRPFANVTFVDFVVRSLPLSATLLGLAYRWRATGLFRPADAKILSWEGAAFLLLRWPWALFGSLAASVDRFRDTPAAFRVTPKGARHDAPLPFRVLAPYLVIAFSSAATARAVGDPGEAAGFYAFCLATAVIYAGLVLLVVWRHARENGLSLVPRSRPAVATALCLAATLGTVVDAAHSRGTAGLAALNLGIEAFTLTRTLFPAAGAGKPGEPTIRFAPEWHGFRAVPGRGEQGDDR